MTVRSAGAGRAARELIKLAIAERIARRARALSAIAKNLHRDAPRGGENVNQFGERRSAPGEAPAMETGGLFAEIDQGVELKPAEATVIVARTVLERGTRRMRPRPLGRTAVAELKARVK